MGRRDTRSAVGGAGGARPGAPGRVRIIAGRWRGRRLPVPDLPALRPTPDRVRETLFNWLAPVIGGARCLDLFAGSGALGLEAASRGASRVLMVERHPKAAANLRDLTATLGANQVEVCTADALGWLGQASETFDVAFLDPPFGLGLLGPACDLLESRGLLVEGGFAYLETESALTELPLPAGWELVRSGRAGEVRYHLACRRGG